MKRFLRENSVPLLVVVLFNMNLLFYTLRPITGRLPGWFIVWGIFFMFWVSAWRNTRGILTRKDAVIVSGWILLLLYSLIMLRREQNTYMIEAAKIVVKGIFMYFTGRMIALNGCKNKNFMKIMAWSSLLVTLIFAIFFRTYILTGNTEAVFSRSEAGRLESYSMSMGYWLLPQLCVASYLMLNGWLMQLPFMIVLLYGVLALGSRGSLVCLLGAIVVTLSGLLDLRSWKSWLLIIVLSVFGGIILLNVPTILAWMLNSFKGLNLSTRTVKFLISGEFISHDSGRGNLRIAALTGIDEHLFMGTGIYRDRQYLLEHVIFSSYNGIPVNSSTGTYSHNILLDFPLQFGIFIGCFILVNLIKMMLKAYKLCLSNYREWGGAYFFMYVVLLSIGLFHLILSGTWVDSPNFYLLMGFVLELLHRKDKIDKRGR